MSDTNTADESDSVSRSDVEQYDMEFAEALLTRAKRVWAVEVGHEDGLRMPPRPLGTENQDKTVYESSSDAKKQYESLKEKFRDEDDVVVHLAEYRLIPEDDDE